MKYNVLAALFNCLPLDRGKVIPLGGPFISSSVVNLDKKFGIVYSPSSPPTEKTFPLYSNMVEKGGLPILTPPISFQLWYKKCLYLPEIIPKPAVILSPIAITDLISFKINELAFLTHILFFSPLPYTGS